MDEKEKVEKYNKKLSKQEEVTLDKPIKYTNLINGINEDIKKERNVFS
ncbi:TPA: hypothetical protein KRH38_003304 [Clostridioides difficile]|nr:hypothetical protein [Clostridioides difficile]